MTYDSPTDAEDEHIGYIADHPDDHDPDEFVDADFDEIDDTLAVGEDETDELTISGDWRFNTTVTLDTHRLEDAAVINIDGTEYSPQDLRDALDE